MGNIDLPGLKQALWYKLRDDLKSLVPWFAANDLLLCPTCCRAIAFDEFSLEHIIPKQALAHDPDAARDAVPINRRSGVTLLCSRRLIWKDRVVSGNGCNGWKGRYFDAAARELLTKGGQSKDITSRHQVALSALGYLGLFSRYGYRVALSASGVLMRKQFFSANNYLQELPLRCQMILAGAPLSEFDRENASYWDDPFKITIEPGAALLGIRSLAFYLPLSDDPTIALANKLPYAPPRYKFRPDFSTAFS